VGASSARILKLAYGLQLQVPHKLLCDRRVERQSYPRDFATKQINYASRRSIPVQEYQEHSSLHSWPLQQQLSINNNSLKREDIPTNASSACSTSTLAASCFSGLAYFALVLAASSVNLAFCTVLLAFIAKLI